MSDRFRQCELTRNVAGGGVVRMVSWIPERIAILNARVRLKDSENGERTEGWTVASVAGPALPGKVLERQSRDHLRVRRAGEL